MKNLKETREKDNEGKIKNGSTKIKKLEGDVELKR